MFTGFNRLEGGISDRQKCTRRDCVSVYFTSIVEVKYTETLLYSSRDELTRKLRLTNLPRRSALNYFCPAPKDGDFENKKSWN